VYNHQKASLLTKLTEAERKKEALAVELKKVEQQLARAVSEVGARSSAAAEAQDKHSRELAALRKDNADLKKQVGVSGSARVLGYDPCRGSSTSNWDLEASAN
jgi:hypothetical protein